MTAYYNEHDPFAAAWLRALIAERLIPDGEVDERDIRDVRPVDLAGFRQCHFFAGIGGWPYALSLAGWPDDRPVWTGSCPCQPFSAAGRREGLADERHLWPSWFWLIEQCGPSVIFGEQVASKAALEQWFDGLVAPDLEGLGYAVAAADLPAAGVGAPHIRQRLYWVADADRERRQQVAGSSSCDEEADGRSRWDWSQPDADHIAAGHGEDGRPHPDRGGWAGADWLGCRDGRWRPVEPGTFPLAHGVPARVGRLRGYGNAIAPQCAQAFIEAHLST